MPTPPYRPYRNSRPQSTTYDPNVSPYDPAPASGHTASTFTQRIAPLPTYEHFRNVPKVPGHTPEWQGPAPDPVGALAPPEWPAATVSHHTSHAWFSLGVIPRAFARLRRWVLQTWNRWRTGSA